MPWLQLYIKNCLFNQFGLLVLEHKIQMGTYLPHCQSRSITDSLYSALWALLSGMSQVGGCHLLLTPHLKTALVFPLPVSRPSYTQHTRINGRCDSCTFFSNVTEVEILHKPGITIQLSSFKVGGAIEGSGKVRVPPMHLASHSPVCHTSYLQPLSQTCGTSRQPGLFKTQFGNYQPTYLSLNFLIK